AGRVAPAARLDAAAHERLAPPAPARLGARPRRQPDGLPAPDQRPGRARPDLADPARGARPDRRYPPLWIGPGDGFVAGIPLAEGLQSRVVAARPGSRLPADRRAGAPLQTNHC